MDAKSSIKPKRHKKKKPRTQVSDSDSESENNRVAKADDNFNNTSMAPSLSTSTSTAKSMTDTEVSAIFTKYYLQRATQEFAEDLDQIRNADDFRDAALPLLVNALQQGTSVFSIEEQRRVVTAGAAKDGK